MIHFIDKGGRRYQARHVTFGTGFQVKESADGLPFIDVSTAYGAIPGLVSDMASLIPFYAGAMGDYVEIDNDVWPSGTDEVDLGIRVWFDFRGFDIVRLQGAVLEGAPPGAKLAVQFSVDNGASWSYFGGSGPELTVSAAGDVYGDDIQIPEEAKKVVLLRLVARM